MTHHTLLTRYRISCWRRDDLLPDTGQVQPERAVLVTPSTGSALLFWHGEHPLSPLHKGAPLEMIADGTTPTPCKYVIRTDVLFTTERPPAWSSDGGWVASNYVKALQFAAAQ